MNQSQRVLVAGTGTSGIAAAKLILERGGEVVLYDGNKELNEKEIKKKFEDPEKVTVVLGEIKRSDLLGVELCIISPGIPLTSPFVAVVDEAKIPVLGEIELAYQCGAGRLAAITGTNGKTTTTALTGEILKAQFEEVFVAGNIGDPYTGQVPQMTEDSVTVLEVSSFQLETIMDFKPDVSAILNITPDHLDRHGTMENYIQIKEGITLNQTDKDAVVLNYDDPVLREFGEREDLKPRVIWFSSREKLKDGFCMDGDEIVWCQNGRQTSLVNVKEMQLLGRHNYENAMAAAAIGMRMGVPTAKISRVLKEFKPVEHLSPWSTGLSSCGSGPACAITMIPREPIRTRPSRPSGPCPAPRFSLRAVMTKTALTTRGSKNLPERSSIWFSSARRATRLQPAPRSMDLRRSCTRRICRRPCRSAPSTRTSGTACF